MIVVRGSCTHELSAKVVVETAILSVAVRPALHLSVIYEAELRSHRCYRVPVAPGF